ncbi:MAG: acetoin utilization protein AcuC [Pseudomonadota bacterium]|nr:MAG: acetoin utilization protein AcuC [Pseudomonadota bacterium]
MADTNNTACGVCVYVGAELARYGFGDDHPFGPDRLDAFWRYARKKGLDKQVTIRAPVAADVALIELFHESKYVARVRTQSKTGTGFLDYGDTPAFAGVFEAAAYVVGSSVDAARRLIAGECRRAFVPIAGLHHARRDGAAGFCVFNDCGVVIESLRRDHGLQRIAYVDIDAHHGDGVFYGFEDAPWLCVVDIHEDGRFLYPGTGAADETGRGKARGTKLNIPMPPDAGDEEFMAAWTRAEDFVAAARPEFIILQCGADSLAGDPITHLRYSPAAHRMATERLSALADQFSNGRLLALGGGGYNRANLARGWSAVLEELIHGARAPT